MKDAVEEQNGIVLGGGTCNVAPCSRWCIRGAGRNDSVALRQRGASKDANPQGTHQAKIFVRF